MRIQNKNRSAAGMTLVEVVFSLLIAALGMGGIIKSYILVAKRVDWTVNSAAAQASALNVYERTMAATWTVGSVESTNVIDELDPTNWPPESVVLTVPKTGATPVNATNFVTITDTEKDPPFLKLIQVDCVWTTQGKVFTNTIMAYRAPNM